MDIRCEFCGTEFNSIKKNCPTCGASCGGNKELESKMREEEELTSQYKKAAFAEFDKAHPYNERLSPRNKNVIKAITILITLLLTLGVIALLIFLSSNAR